MAATRITLPADFDGTLTYGDHTIAVTEIAPEGIAYLLQYGFSQSLQDVIAGPKASMAKAKDEAGLPKYTDVEIAVACHDKQAERVRAIAAGTVGSGRGGVRGTALDTVMREVAREAVKAALKAKGLKMPETAKFNELVAAHLAKSGETIKAEAERRMALAASLADVDVGV